MWFKCVCGWFRYVVFDLVHDLGAFVCVSCVFDDIMSVVYVSCVFDGMLLCVLYDADLGPS